MSRLDDMKILYDWILDDLKPETLIIAGTFINDESDVKWQEFLHGDNIIGKRIRYVAKRGQIADWAIYADHEKFTDEKILAHGQKIYSLDVVKQLVKCDESALKRYRQ